MRKVGLIGKIVKCVSKEIIKKRCVRGIETKKDITLIYIDSNPVSPATDIEDTLDPNIFIQVLKEFILEKDENFNFVYRKEPDTKAKCSYSCFDYTESERDKIREFFKLENNKRKTDFAKKYIEKDFDYSKLSIFKEIQKLFKW